MNNFNLKKYAFGFIAIIGLAFGGKSICMNYQTDSLTKDDLIRFLEEQGKSAMKDKEINSLIKKKFDNFSYAQKIDFVNNYGNLEMGSPVYWAFYYKNLEIVELFLKYLKNKTIDLGKNKKEELRPGSASIYDKKEAPSQYYSPLDIQMEIHLKAAINNYDLKMVKLLLKHGANVDANEVDGFYNALITVALPKRRQERVVLKDQNKKETKETIDLLLNDIKNFDKTDDKKGFINKQKNEEFKNILIKRLEIKFGQMYKTPEKAFRFFDKKNKRAIKKTDTIIKFNENTEDNKNID